MARTLQSYDNLPQSRNSDAGVHTPPLVVSRSHALLSNDFEHELQMLTNEIIQEYDEDSSSSDGGYTRGTPDERRKALL